MSLILIYRTWFDVSNDGETVMLGSSKTQTTIFGNPLEKIAKARICEVAFIDYHGNRALNHNRKPTGAFGKIFGVLAVVLTVLGHAYKSNVGILFQIIGFYYQPSVVKIGPNLWDCPNAAMLCTHSVPRRVRHCWLIIRCCEYRASVVDNIVSFGGGSIFSFVRADLALDRHLGAWRVRACRDISLRFPIHGVLWTASIAAYTSHCAHARDAASDCRFPAVVDKVEGNRPALLVAVGDGVEPVEAPWVDRRGPGVEAAAAVQVPGVVPFGAVVALEIEHVLGGCVDPVPLVARPQLPGQSRVVEEALEGAAAHKIDVGRERGVRNRRVHGATVSVATP